MRIADEPMDRSTPQTPLPETLADVALVYNLVNKLNDVCRRLKQAQVHVSVGGYWGKEDPLAQTAAVRVEMRLDAAGSLDKQ
jgi:hypothetical protein